MAQRRGPDGTCRVAVSGSIHGEAWANVFWANLIGGTTATQAALDAWTDSFGTAYKTSVSPRLHVDVGFSTIQSTLFQPTESALHSTRPLTGTGVLTGPLVMDLSACQVLSWTSTVYWRGGKPRTYLPGVETAMTSEGKTLLDAEVNGLRVAAQNLHTAINGLSATGITQTQHGFVSFMTGGVDRVPSVFFAITGGTAHKRIGTQRRRLGPWLPG